MPDVRVRITKEFYWWLKWYAEVRGHKSLAAALLELTSLGMRDIKHAQDIELSTGQWGGYRHGKPQEDDLTDSDYDFPDLSYLDDINPGF